MISPNAAPSGAPDDDRHRNPDALERRLDADPLDIGALIGLSDHHHAEGDEARALALGPRILMGYFRQEHGRTLDRAAPRTFTEKLYCRMLDCHQTGCGAFPRLADKLRVREHIAATIGERYLNRLVWHGDDIRALPWDRMPSRALLKCSEGSGKLTELEPDADRAAIERLARGWQASSYYWRRREYHYWEMPRGLLVEESIADGHPDGPLDYVFFCFDGRPRLVQIGSRSHTLHRFYTPDWRAVRLSYRERYEAPDIARPAGLDEMLDVAARLSDGFDFVRIDLYESTAGVRFGEMTFTPRAGKLAFDPPEWDVILGDWWRYTRPDLQKPASMRLARS